MAKRGRPNKYDEYVKPHLKEIEVMCQTMTEAQIAESLGVSYDSWIKYKKEFSELSEVIKRGRQSLVNEMKSILIKRARGFNYTETKIIKDNDGKEKVETYSKACVPDVAAINLLLKNYDKDNWANDPQAIMLRQRELDIQERRLEMNEW